VPVDEATLELEGDPKHAEPRAGERMAGSKVETQARILESALLLFGERGFERTSVTLIAARAGVSRAAVFWHFGDKATLFREACKQLMAPFVQELGSSVKQLDGRERLFQLLSAYEQMVSEHQQTIETFVRWFLESPSLRASLHGQLLGLHEAFGREVREALEQILHDPAKAIAIAAGLVSTMDGNLLLSLVDPDPAACKRRCEGLMAIAELAIAQSSGS
jgi:AcrR family transcriptional regulator